MLRSARFTCSVAVAVLALAAVAVPSVAAETVPVKDGGELIIASTNSPPNWNPVSAVGDITTNRQQQWPLYPHPFLTGTDASVTLNSQFLKSAEVVSTDPMIVEYVIRDEAVWSDGTPITVKDFEYTQQVQDPRACAECKAAFTQGYSLVSAIESNDSGKLVRITFETPFAPWKTLFPYILPAHVAAGYGDLATSFNAGLSENVPTVSGGPYLVGGYEDGVVMTLVKNPAWYGNPAHLDTIRVRYIASIDEQITALQNGEINAVYGGATLDTVEQVNQMSGVTVALGPTRTYYHFSLKASGDVMGELVLRQAIVKALDIADMTLRTVGQYVAGAMPMTSAAYIPARPSSRTIPGPPASAAATSPARRRCSPGPATRWSTASSTRPTAALRDIEVLTTPSTRSACSWPSWRRPSSPSSASPW